VGRAHSICKRPGCGQSASARGFCPAHAPAPRPDNRPNAHQRGYGRDWRTIRDKHLREYPWCAVCGETGTDVDHIVTRKQGGADDDANLQTLCHSHHSEKTVRQDGGFGNARR